WTYNFSGNDLRKFLALRFDANINKANSIEAVINRQHFVPSGQDFLNSVEQRFPGDFFHGYSQGSNRNTYSFAVRSTISASLVNEARVAMGRGISEFRPGITAADYANQGGANVSNFGGFTLGTSFGPTFESGNAATGASSSAQYSSRSTPTTDWTDSLNWIHGDHSFNFGGQFKRITSTAGVLVVVPSVAFGIDSSEGVASTMWNSTTATVPGDLPGASSTQTGIARQLYASLTGHVLSFSNTALLKEDGTYGTNVLQSKTARQDIMGVFGQDSWKIKPNLTLNFGLRWQPQRSPVVMSGNWSRQENYNELFGISGPGNLFKPGATGGSPTQFVAMKIGEKAYRDDWNNFAPTVGAVWSPNFKGGLGKFLFGEADKTVLRGGYSWAFVREGLNIVDSIIGGNPGGQLSASRSVAGGTMTPGTLFRTAGNPNLTNNPFSATPSFPILLVNNQFFAASAYSPDLHTGRVESYSFGIQREVDKNSVVEIRYVGNRGKELQRQFDYNEFNTVENGFAAEFLKAQQNLYLNMAAGKGPTFAYRTDVPGSNQLPIMLGYFTNFGSAAALATAAANPANYTATNFANATLVTSLSKNNPNLAAWAGTNFEANTTRRANAVANGFPANFFYVNPQAPPQINGNTIFGGAFTVDNSGHSWFDSLQVEFRRRLSQGLRVQTSYVWSKALSDSVASSAVVFNNYSQRPGGLAQKKNFAVFDIAHALKFDATYDLPFGRGRQFFSNTNRVLDGILGGWSVLPSFRLQSGSPLQLGNVQLVGMTAKELQKMVKINKNVLDNGPQGAGATTFQVAWLPLDIIQQSRAAFNVDPTTATGYSAKFGVPTGKFIAPAGYGNCLNTSVNTQSPVNANSPFVRSDCGFNNLILHGPRYFKFDVTVLKQFKITETMNIELAATALDALNKPNWRVGGWGSDAVTATNASFGAISSTAFGFLGNGTAYQDVSTTNDNGGRQIDLRIRINW
ncbi:MAG: TonB-dependent receptor, partial [Acidobacteria bacterium]|nr:TonB-dependent receptor [Acidobacteriota bacterium]